MRVCFFFLFHLPTSLIALHIYTSAKYEPATSTTTCRSHVRFNHSAIYDKAVVENNWHYPLSTDAPAPGSKTTDHRLQKRLPPFTHDSFIHYLVRFIVADDQVSLFLSLNSCLTFFIVNSRGRMSRIPRPLFASLPKLTRQRHPPSRQTPGGDHRQLAPMV